MEKLFLISGPSGVGKTTIVRKVTDNEIVSFTTRQKRANEEEGKDYYFITKDEFYNLLNNHGLVEWTEYSGQNYGITVKEIEEKLKNKPAFVASDFNGVNQLKELYPNSVTIFVYSSYQEILKQLKLRNETHEFIIKRMSKYQDEMNNRMYYDYVIKNRHGYLDKTVEIVKKIVEAES